LGLSDAPRACSAATEQHSLRSGSERLLDALLGVGSEVSSNQPYGVRPVTRPSLRRPAAPPPAAGAEGRPALGRGETS